MHDKDPLALPRPPPAPRGPRIVAKAKATLPVGFVFYYFISMSPSAAHGVTLIIEISGRCHAHRVPCQTAPLFLGTKPETRGTERGRGSPGAEASPRKTSRAGRALPHPPRDLVPRSLRRPQRGEAGKQRRGQCHVRVAPQVPGACALFMSGRARARARPLVSHITGPSAGTDVPH